MTVIGTRHRDRNSILAHSEMLSNQDATPPDTRIFSPLAVAGLCVPIGRYWYLFKRLTAVSAGRFYRFEHIVTYSSGKVVAKSDRPHPYIARGDNLSRSSYFWKSYPVFLTTVESRPRTLVSISLAPVLDVIQGVAANTYGRTFTPRQKAT